MERGATRAHTLRNRARVSAAGGMVALAGVLGLQGSLAADGLSLVVDSTRDAVDARLGDGVCATAAADCSLRAAIQEANALAGPQQIVLPAGTYALALRPQNDNLADNGDWDVTGPVEIVGAGAAGTILDGGEPPAGSPADAPGLDRLFEIHAAAGDVSISGLTIQSGYSAETGGGIQYAASGVLRLEDVAVLGSYARKFGGGVSNAGNGRVELIGSTVSGNGAKEGGAALNNAAAGTMLVERSVVSDNPGAFELGAGAIGNQAQSDAIGTIEIRESTIAGNRSLQDGAGINNDGDGKVFVHGSDLTLNVSLSKGGGIYTASGPVVVSDSTVSENEAAVGGGVANAGGLMKSGEPSRVELVGSTVARNSATSGGGGGIHSQLEGELTLTNTTVSDNAAATEGGGLVSLHKAILSVSGSSFTGNSAGTSGGGVYTLSEPAVSFAAVVFADNSAGQDGGALYLGGLEPISIADSTFSGNQAGLDGGGIAISAKGSVTIERSELRGNVANASGGGIQNNGSLVTLRELVVEDNTASGNGGGIDNTSSGDFVVVDTTIDDNRGADGGGFANSPDSTLLMSRSALSDNRATGSGGGLYSVSDGDSVIENTTVSGNAADVSGGGLFHDADGQLDLVHLTVWGNSAPLGGGISTTETDTVPSFPPTPNASIVLRNTIVGGSLRGGSCDAMLTSMGGNLDRGTSCLFNGPRDRSNADPGLEALADNGGTTRTHALTPGGLAIDGGVDPCPDTDQRGVVRPQHAGCDSGAFEFDSAPPVPDAAPPETSITSAARAPNGMPVLAFTGSDDVSAADELAFECRILRLGPGQQPPSDAAPFAPCSSPHAVTEVEHGENTFEVRAVDRAGNVDPTPARAAFVDESDTTAPETALEAMPADPSLAEEAVFGFTGTDDLTPLVLLAFECRLDPNELTPWVLCRSPESLTGNPLAIGLHSFEVRAVDLAGNVDPSPATFVWEVMAPPDTIIDSGPEDSDSADVVFTFSSDQQPATFECAVDAALFEPCTSPHELIDVPVGDHVLAVRATNVHGLTDVTPATHPWKVAPDVTPPETTIDAGPPAAGESTTAEVVFSASQRRSTFACSLDGAAFAPCASPRTYTDLAVGSHTIAVRATDPVGNTDPTPASRAWTVLADVTAPETELLSGPAGPSATAAVSFEFAATDPGRPESVPVFECSLDGASFAACASPQEYVGLGEGAHAFQVRAVDAAGNVDASPASFAWRVDTISPETSVTSGPDAVTSSTSAAFGFGADEPASFECALDGAPFGECGSPHGLADGDHELSVRAIDEAGNVDASPAVHRWRVDTVAPETTILAAPADPSPSSAALFAFAADESASFECSLDGAPFAACSSPLLLVGLADGEHKFEMRAVDEARNLDASAAAFAWRVDTLAPETSIDSGPDALTSSIDASFAFSADEPASFECSLDGAPYAPCSSPHEYVGLADDGHSFEVRAVDEAGNVDASPASLDWRVDTVAPETTITSGPGDVTSSRSASLAFTSDEPASFECSLDSAPFTGCESPQEHVGLADGAHELAVRAIDEAGNVDASPAAFGWRVDTVAPETSITSAPPEVTSSTSAAFAFAADEAASFECSLDGEPYGECGPPQGLADGQHSFAVRAVDEAGNVDPSPAVHRWRVDTVAPQAAITAAPADPSATPTAQFGFAADEPASFECSLDDAPFAACEAPREYAGLADGAHELAVRAIDEAGNVDASPSVHRWRVDTVAPETTIMSAPADPSPSSAALFAFAADESASFECSLDGAPFAACSSPLLLVGLADGQHELEVRAIDEAGNVDASPASFGWRVDTVAPDTVIDSGPPASTNDAAATFTFSSEPGAVFECSLDSAAFGACSSPQEYVGLADDQHELEVRAIDEAGNVDGSPASFGWRVDTVAPDTVIDSGPPASTNDAAATFTFSSDPGAVFQCSLDGAAFAPCTSPREHAGLARGAHRFEVRAVDEAGNADASPAAHLWTVVAPPDVTPPETLIDSGPPAETVSTEASFEFSADEAGSSFECSLDAAPFAACAAPQLYDGLAVGAHRFEVRATDADGNTDASPAAHGWTVVQPPDVTSPETVIDSGPPAETASTEASFVFSADEPGSSFECSLDGAAFTVCISPRLYAGVSLGAHGFAVRATDAAGNTDASPATYAWTVVPPPDVTAPETVIDSGPPAGTASRDASFAFSANEDGSTFECSLDGGTFAVCVSPRVYLGLAVGEHLFEVRATDAAGNTDASPAVHQWSIVPPPDVTAPETTIDSGPDASTTSTSAVFAFSANELGARFECSLDGAASTDCGSPAAYTGLALGAHRFEVRATDAAGNVDASPAFFEWTVVAPPDVTAPETTIGSGPPAVTTSTSALFTFTANELGTRFECALDGAPYAPCASPQAYVGLALGAHRFEVRATDAADNTDASSAVHAWRIDPPSVACPSLTLVSSADSWLDQNSAANNFGGDSILKVRSKGPRDNFRALVQFALPPGIPQGCRVGSASLRLFAASATPGRDLHALRVATSWSESGVTWNAQPGTAGAPATTASGVGARVWDVTAHVQAMYDSAALHGFLIRDAAENADAEQSFHSREKGESAPVLTVVFAPAGG